MSSSTRKKKTILFLAANPKNSTPLDLTREAKEIEEGLQLSQKRDGFVLKQEWAVTPGDVQRAMLRYKPQIVHFSGHGMGESGLVLEDEVGQAQFVKSTALAGLFELFADKGVECVVLNACYSEVQAVAIAHHIPYVVGMSQAVGDRAARMFAVGFYDALGAGESFDFAYKLGRNRIALEGIAEDLTPVITRKLEVVSLPLPETPEPIDAPPEPSPAPVLAEPSRLDSIVTPVKDLALEEPEGQVPLESVLYVERPPIEARCYETIAKPGALIRIKAPRQMGKSSLMIRIMNHAMQQGHRVTSLHFQSAGGQVLSSLDQFLYWFCSRITRRLGLADKVGDYWQGALGSNDKCTDYFDLYLLPELNCLLTLCLDEVDELFKHPMIASDFFGLLRAWHEESKINPTWQNLRLVITHSKEVYIPLNINQSPFNVGLPIELPPLNREQVVDLIQRHGLQWSDAEVGQLMAIVGGHPYLVRVALYHLARNEMTLDKLLEVAPTEEWVYGEHLRRHLLNLEDDAHLIAAFRQVLAAEKPVRVKSAEAFKLVSMGLVRYQGNDVIPLCNLYRQYFRDRLGVGQ
ncbi:AAA-like domain-containing protein [Leptolyngbya sp. FACHB-711]|uniref:AAA-like domain-containing protein n=1 Tax=Leptolyngbya sp. FACHB-711 TaxID=2692813 RepID=UPI001686BB86|nr:AAA-like domain-containing protein [Leptolyngbya sp. FACHB-711]MBD2028168.1 AAA-like domain-containing protein [Leptolyngbya sp. FACHB-711]